MFRSYLDLFKEVNRQVYLPTYFLTKQLFWDKHKKKTKKFWKNPKTHSGTCPTSLRYIPHLTYGRLKSNLMRNFRGSDIDAVMHFWEQIGICSHLSCRLIGVRSRHLRLYIVESFMNLKRCFDLILWFYFFFIFQKAVIYVIFVKMF